MKTTRSYLFTWAGVRAGSFVLISSLLLIMFAQTGFGQFLIPGYSPPTQGLVAWWQANGDATDSVGGHNGTLMGGASFVPGVYGQAFSFGSGERVYVPDSPAFRLSSLTIGAFVYVKANSWTILQRGDTRSGYDPYNLGQDGAGHFDMQLVGTNDVATDLQTPVVLNRWVHIATTFDANSGDLRIYLDGNLAAEETTSIRPLLDLDPTLTPGIGIGNTPSLYDFPLLGNIDEVVLYSRALSPSEVISLVPEPSALGLAVLGLAMLGRRRKA